MSTTKQVYRKFRDSGIGLLSFLLLGLLATWTWVSHNKTDPPSEPESSHVAASHSSATTNLVSARASVTGSNASNPALSPLVPDEQSKSSGANRAAVDIKEATIWDGQKVAAEVKVGDKIHHLFADGVQPFQRVYIKPEERVDITVNYSEEQAGDPVVIQAEDGGSLDDGKFAKVVKLDDKHNLAFSFQASPNNGIHRVTLWRLNDRKVLDFWAGDPLPVAGQ